VTAQRAAEIAANLERAELSIRAARQLLSGGYYDFAASRAYYAAFYAATAVLLSEGLELSKHSGVIAAIHQRLVKAGKLDKEQGQTLNWLFEVRGVGDYGTTLSPASSPLPATTALMPPPTWPARCACSTRPTCASSSCLALARWTCYTCCALSRRGRMASSWRADWRAPAITWKVISKPNGGSAMPRGCWSRLV
jgi:uncharacterized protein (UPF0332 family)